MFCEKISHLLHPHNPLSHPRHTKNLLEHLYQKLFEVTLYCKYVKNIFSQYNLYLPGGSGYSGGT